jgi:hypothetical protein
MVSKDECIATARSPFQKAADGLIPKAASVGGHELHANDAVALARAHHESGCLPQFSNPSRFNNHHAVPEHLSKAQTAKVYDAGVQNRTAPQTICSCDPLRVCYFGDADDAACLQFGRHQLDARDKPHDQCSRRRGPE